MVGNAMDGPAFTLAVALAAGTLAQAIARHLRLPGIVVLLATGIVLGPDVAGLVRPDRLGAALFDIVGFAVAVILFEGGMSLQIARLRREGRAIRQLVTAGAIVSAVGGTLAVKLLLGWDWRPSILFGTLVIVTGPTVVGPLLRRIKVEQSVATVLAAEGVLIDAVGAVVAMVTLELALSPASASVGGAALGIVSRLGVGSVLGLAGGGALWLLLSRRHLVPEGLEKITTLSLVLVLYEGANAIVPESGIAAVIVAGVLVGNGSSHVQRDLSEFKEELTVMLIGLLFVLLAASVRLSDVRALGWRGMAVVGVLVFAVRPASVAVGTYGSELRLRQRLFLAWIGPRGVVAAAIASLFAAELRRYGVPGGEALQAMVFLVIASTVVLAGLTGRPIASVLGVKRRTDDGWVLLGASDLCIALGQELAAAGEKVVCVDANANACEAARGAGLVAVQGNALEGDTLERAEIDTRSGVAGLTPNEEVNWLFAQRAKREGKVARIVVGLRDLDRGITSRHLETLDASLLFGRAASIGQWNGRLATGAATLERWTAGSQGDVELASAGGDELFLPLVLRRGKRAAPFDDRTRPRAGDVLSLVSKRERAGETEAWLSARGWKRMVSASQETQALTGG